MQLIYISPVTWHSFEQRPHQFVRWFHQRKGNKVLWIEPYPTRLPQLQDVQLLTHKKTGQHKNIPPWLHIVKPVAFPIEPLFAAKYLQAILWQNIFKQTKGFIADQDTVICCAKPCELALQIFTKFPDVVRMYDAMDNFPDFYRGLSKLSMYHKEQSVIQKIDNIITSSTFLVNKFDAQVKNIQLINNGYDPSVLPSKLNKKKYTQAQQVLGYLGTIAKWFDWQWVIDLATLYPKLNIQLVGPIYGNIPSKFPINIQLMPECSHEQAMHVMSVFSVGLIPFKKNKLTNCVDPIKYYEYRALNIPVISTSFGEMILHEKRDKNGLFIADSKQQIEQAVVQALDYQTDDSAISYFKIENTWTKRFDAIKLV